MTVKLAILLANVWAVTLILVIDTWILLVLDAYLSHPTMIIKQMFVWGVQVVVKLVCLKVYVFHVLRITILLQIVNALRHVPKGLYSTHYTQSARDVPTTVILVGLTGVASPAVRISTLEKWIPFILGAYLCPATFKFMFQYVKNVQQTVWLANQQYCAWLALLTLYWVLIISVWANVLPGILRTTWPKSVKDALLTATDAISKVSVQPAAKFWIFELFRMCP